MRFKANFFKETSALEIYEMVMKERSAFNTQSNLQHKYCQIITQPGEVPFVPEIPGEYVMSSDTELCIHCWNYYMVYLLIWWIPLEIKTKLTSEKTQK